MSRAIPSLLITSLLFACPALAEDPANTQPTAAPTAAPAPQPMAGPAMIATPAAPVMQPAPSTPQTFNAPRPTRGSGNWGESRGGAQGGISMQTNTPIAVTPTTPIVTSPILTTRDAQQPTSGSRPHRNSNRPPRDTSPVLQPTPGTITAPVLAPVTTPAVTPPGRPQYPRDANGNGYYSTRSGAQGDWSNRPKPTKPHYYNNGSYQYYNGHRVRYVNRTQYIPVPIYYYGTIPAQQYYYSQYYTTRPVYMQPEQSYVEVRCTNQPIIGTVVGGVAGGLVGNQFGKGSGRTALTIGGALLGAVVGRDIGLQDESCAYQALEYAQPDTQVVWTNPDADYSYTVTPGPISKQANGRYCREYQAQILVGSELQNGYGTACRQPDGSWQVEN